MYKYLIFFSFLLVFSGCSQNFYSSSNDELLSKLKKEEELSYQKIKKLQMEIRELDEQKEKYKEDLHTYDPDAVLEELDEVLSKEEDIDQNKTNQ